MRNHPLHERIGSFLKEKIKIENIEIILDPACEKEQINNSEDKQRIPLFKGNKSRVNQLCNVDILILRDKKIKVIIEIEESNIIPTQICGKFLTSALATHYIHLNHNNEKPIDFDNEVFFIQILDSSKLKENSVKLEQGIKIEKAIRDILPIKDSRITHYKIIYMNNDLDKKKCLFDSIYKKII